MKIYRLTFKKDDSILQVIRGGGMEAALMECSDDEADHMDTVNRSPRDFDELAWIWSSRKVNVS